MSWKKKKMMWMVKMRIEGIEFTKQLYMVLHVQSRLKKLTNIIFDMIAFFCRSSFI